MKFLLALTAAALMVGSLASAPVHAAAKAGGIEAIKSPIVDTLVMRGGKGRGGRDDRGPDDHGTHGPNHP